MTDLFKVDRSWSVARADEKHPRRTSEAQTAEWPEPRHSPLVLDLGSDIEIASRIHEGLVAAHGRVVRAEGHLWRYLEGRWVPLDPDALRLMVHRFDGAAVRDGRGARVRLNRSRVDSVLNELSAMTACRDFFSAPTIGINCRSGLVRFRDDGAPFLEPPRSDHRVRHVLPGRWPVDISRDDFERSLLAHLLCGCFDADPDGRAKIDLLSEICGAIALGIGTRLTNPKAIIFKGDRAANGKSQILDLLRGLLPPEATCCIPTSKLADERHVVRLAGAHLNACDELSSATAITGDAFKAAVTGEPLTGRAVYRLAVTFRPVAVHVYATNELPEFKGGFDRGVRCRLLVLPFNRVIPERERVERIGSRVAVEEADLLLHFAVCGAARLLRAGGYTVPESSAWALAEWVRGADPVHAWIEARVMVVHRDNAPRIRTRDAYAAFRAWALAEGFRAADLPAVNHFVQRLVAACRGVRIIRPKRISTLIGLAILPEGEEASDPGWNDHAQQHSYNPRE